MRAEHDQKTQLDLRNAADLEVLISEILIESEEESRNEHGAPDFTEHLPEIANAIATFLNPDDLRNLSRATQMIPMEIFSFCIEMITHVLEKRGVTRHQFRSLNFLTNVWAGRVLNAISQHQSLR